MNILCLDDYSLLLIFEKCSLQDQYNLTLVSRKFYRLVEDYILPKIAANLLLTGTETSFINKYIYFYHNIYLFIYKLLILYPLTI